MQSPAESKRASGLASAAIWGGMAAVFPIVLGVARSKVTAVTLGPDGVGIAAEILPFATLAVTPVSMLFGAALIRRVASTPHGELASSLAGIWSLAIAALAALCGLGLLVAQPVLPAQARSLDLVVAALIAAALGVAIQFPVQILTAQLAYRRASVVTAATSAIIAASFIAGTIIAGLRGQFYAFAVSSAVALPVAWLLSGLRPPGIRWRLSVSDRAFVLEAVTLGIAAMAGSLLLQAAVIGMRILVANASGDSDVGQFQAAWVLGHTYFMIVLSALTSFAFPRFAAAASNDEVHREIEAASAFVLRQAFPVALIAIAIRHPLLVILYSDRFAGASEIVGVQMAGDMAKALAWVYSGCILYRGTASRVIVNELIGASVLFGAFLWLQPRLGIDAVGPAYVISYAIYLPVTAFAVARLTGRSPSLKFMMAAYAGVVLLLGANALTVAVPGARYVLLAIGVTLLARSPVVMHLLGQLRAYRSRRAV